MALALNIPSDYGVAAEYHRIGAAHINWLDRGLSITLFSYIDAAARAGGKQPLGTVTLQLTPEEYNFEADSLSRAELYRLIKQRPAWQDARDA